MKRVYFFSPAFCLAVSLLAVPVLAHSVGPAILTNQLNLPIALPDTVQGQILLGLAAYFIFQSARLSTTKQALSKRIIKSCFYLWMGLSIYNLTTLDNHVLNGSSLNKGDISYKSVDTFEGGGQTYSNEQPPIIHGASCGTIAP